jgi:hypothetical protein
MELIVQECILNAVRESIPIESILRAYMDETVEEDVVEEIKEQLVEKSAPINAQGETEFISEVKEKEKDLNKEKEKTSEKEVHALESNAQSNSLKFNDMDSMLDDNNKEQIVNAPKTIERLEEISTLRNIQRKMEEEDDDDKLKISDQDVELGNLDIHIIGQPGVKLEPDLLLDDIEILS